MEQGDDDASSEDGGDSSENPRDGSRPESSSTSVLLSPKSHESQSRRTSKARSGVSNGSGDAESASDAMDVEEPQPPTTGASAEQKGGVSTRRGPPPSHALPPQGQKASRKGQSSSTGVAVSAPPAVDAERGGVARRATVTARAPRTHAGRHAEASEFRCKSAKQSCNPAPEEHVQRSTQQTSLSCHVVWESLLLQSFTGQLGGAIDDSSSQLDL